MGTTGKSEHPTGEVQAPELEKHLGAVSWSGRKLFVFDCIWASAVDQDIMTGLVAVRRRDVLLIEPIDDANDAPDGAKSMIVVAEPPGVPVKFASPETVDVLVCRFEGVEPRV